MTKKLILPALIFSSQILFAQNLVPFPSFETDDANVINCGIYLQSDFNSSANVWITPTNGTPDLFSTDINQACWNFQPNSTYPGPICLKGSQLPRTGRVMAGIGCYSIPGMNQREYVQSEFTAPMIQGNLYYIEFYVSLADNTESYISTIGAYLSDQPVFSINDQVLPYSPQIVSSSPIADTSGWTKISGTFVAPSALNYITVGNFSDDASTTTSPNPGGGTGPGCYGAYYFLDDVSVLDLTAGVIDPVRNISVDVYPNPATEKINFTGMSSGDYKVSLYDVTSRKLISVDFTNSTSVDIYDFAKGVYLYEIRSNSGILKKGKFIKN